MASSNRTPTTHATESVSAGVFVPLPERAWYYNDIRTPSLQQNSFYMTFIEPWIKKTDTFDPTYGRYTLPFHPDETAIRNEVHAWDARIFTSNDKKEWIFYQVWESKDLSKRRNRDLVYCHGVNDFGGKFALHARKFIEAGYRVILPDLWSHGRSTGLHGYITSCESLAAAVDAVICDVAERDRKQGQTQAQLDARKRFIAGSSMGGFTALLYALQYPSEPISEAMNNSEHPPRQAAHEPILGRTRPKLDGAMILCPMLEIAPESRPSYLVETFARAVSKIAGRWPLAEANRGKNHWDRRLEHEFELDPQTYSGKLRIATGLSLLQGILDISKRFKEVNLPFIVLHGQGDRVTNWRGSQRLYDQASSIDKSIKLYPGMEHVLLRAGDTQEDDQERQMILQDMLDWPEKH